jgi:hypothetical protein
LEGVKRSILSEKFSSAPAYQLALDNAIKNKYILINKETDSICRTKEDLTDKTKEELLWVKSDKKENINAGIIKELKRRKLVEEKQRFIYDIRKGKNYKQKR